MVQQNSGASNAFLCVSCLLVGACMNATFLDMLDPVGKEQCNWIRSVPCGIPEKP